MRELFTLAALILTHVGVNAQSATVVAGDVHIHTSGEIAFHGNVEVQVGASLRNEDGTLYTNGVDGEARVQLDASSSLQVVTDTFTLSHEQNEVLTNVTIGTSGVLEVQADNTLNVSGNFSNGNVGGTGLRLLADATGYAQIIPGTVTLNGPTEAQQYITASTTAGWRQLGSPVDTRLSEIDDDFQTFYPSAPGPTGTAAQWNIWWYDASPVGGAGGTSAGDGSSANANRWTVAADNADPFAPSNDARAYTVYVGAPFAISNGGVLDVNGDVGDGSYTFDVFTTHDYIDGSGGITTHQLITGWNLIPNPYPSNIDVSVLLADGINFDLAYKAVHVWDATSQQYTSITDDIGNAINWNTAAGPIAETNNIAPFQAFWVKGDYTAPSNSATATEDITLTNAHRTLDGTMNVFKTTPPMIAVRTWDNADQLRDQGIIAFEQNATMGVDAKDAYKLQSTNPNVPNLSIMANGVKMSINRVNMPEPSVSIPVHFESRYGGSSYHMTVATQDLDPNWVIHLEDKKEGTLTLMNGSPTYTFSHDASFVGDRFVVHVNRNSVSAIENAQTEDIVVYNQSDYVCVRFDNVVSPDALVRIMSVTGQLLFEGKVSTEEDFRIQVNNAHPLCIVSVNTDHL